MVWYNLVWNCPPLIQKCPHVQPSKIKWEPHKEIPNNHHHPLALTSSHTTGFLWPCSAARKQALKENRLLSQRQCSTASRKPKRAALLQSKRNWAEEDYVVMKLRRFNIVCVIQRPVKAKAENKMAWVPVDLCQWVISCAWLCVAENKGMRALLHAMAACVWLPPYPQVG